MSDSNFIKLAEAALNPDRQYYTLINRYNQGKLNVEEMPNLAKMAKKFGNNTIADSIARHYMENYLFNLSEEELLNKNVLEFVGSFRRVLSSNDKLFNLFYNNGRKVDMIMWNGYSKALVDYFISKDEIFSVLLRDKKIVVENPNWDQLTKKIEGKYSKDIADRIVINNQIQWYDYKKDWANLAKYNVLKIDKYGLDTAGSGKFNLNGMIWDVIFLHSNDPKILNKAINWMATLVKANPEEPAMIDTYANLLYKTGRRKEAILWEKKAVKIEIKNASNASRKPDPTFGNTLQKMLNRLPTWNIVAP